MTQQQKKIGSDIKTWIANNAMTIIAFVSLSWQISSKIVPGAYRGVSNFIDTVKSNSMSLHNMERDFSAFKIDQHIVDSGQNHKIDKIDRLIAKQP